MSRLISVVGAPSSAGAYAPGQEDAPAALRDAGLVERLRAAGLDVRDAGDLPRFRWRPDRADPAAQNFDQVVTTAQRVRDAVAAAIDRDEFALVLGGDCTVGVGTVAGSVRAGGETGLVYLDMHADLNVPASVPDGALDWMGVAHMLAVEGCRPGLRDIGPRTPLLDPAAIVVLGHEPGQATAWELDAIARMGLACVTAERLRADPGAAAADALRRLPGGATRLVVHLDVDVVDFVDAPLSENTGRNVGVPLAAALAGLAAVMRDERVQALTVTELNPTHAAADPGALERLCAGFAGAFAGPAR
ncbi:MAG TPA: arginase family protein [Gaiellales bacterium]|jgi:arginase